MEINDIKLKLKRELTENRYIHTIGVADTAFCLALRYNTDCEKAYLAGLLHDCAKCLSADKRNEYIKKYGIILTENQKNNPELIHAELGYYMAKDIYNIIDDEILNSIKYHTTGKKEMCLLEKIIFSADFIVPNRKMIPGLNDVRKLIFYNFDAAIIKIYDCTFRHLRNTGNEIDEISLEAYEYYLQSLNTPNTLPII